MIETIQKWESTETGFATVFEKHDMKISALIDAINLKGELIIKKTDNPTICERLIFPTHPDYIGDISAEFFDHDGITEDVGPSWDIEHIDMIDPATMNDGDDRNDEIMKKYVETYINRLNYADELIAAQADGFCTDSTNGEDKLFELVNEDNENWIDVQFVESDPYKGHESLASIVLLVDWEEQNAIVETEYNTGSTSIKQWHHLHQSFNLPADLDASLFVDYYNEKIKPELQKKGEFFESVWNGSNFVGKFTDETEDSFNNMDFSLKMIDLCNDAPTHDKITYFNIISSFESAEDIIDWVAPAIDFMTADLDNPEVVKKIMDMMSDDCVFLNSDDAEDLKNIRDEIIYNREEDN